MQLVRQANGEEKKRNSFSAGEANGFPRRGMGVPPRETLRLVVEVGRRVVEVYVDRMHERNRRGECVTEARRTNLNPQDVRRANDRRLAGVRAARGKGLPAQVAHAER